MFFLFKKNVKVLNRFKKNNVQIFDYVFIELYVIEDENKYWFGVEFIMDVTINTLLLINLFADYKSNGSLITYAHVFVSSN
jgi:hypothetical protein